MVSSKYPLSSQSSISAAGETGLRDSFIGIETISIEARTPEILAGLLAIWEASVRASHHFLTEDDITSLFPQAEDAIRQIETLLVACDGDTRIGFMGVQSGKIEMLFLHPDYFRKGIGSALIRKAFSELGVRYVDVNEQNPSAVRFYERMGFRTFRLDSTDDQGNPFPILRSCFEICQKFFYGSFRSVLSFFFQSDSRRYPFQKEEPDILGNSS